MTHDFLNPLELFRLTNTPVELLTPEYLRGQKRRFLSELEVDGKEYFIYHGQQYTRNDLERVVEEASTPEGREAYLAAGKLKGFAAFLVTAKVPSPGSFKPNRLEDPALQLVLKNYLFEVYPKALRLAMKQQEWHSARTLLSWQPHRFGLSPIILYAALDQYLERLAPFVLDILKRFSCNTSYIYTYDFKVPKHKAKYWVRGMRLFNEQLPQELTEYFPPYTSPHLNSLVRNSLPHLKTMCQGAETPLARSITKRLLKFPHLNKENTYALRILLSRNRVHLLDVLIPSEMDSRLMVALKMLCLMGVILGAAQLLATCN